MRKYELQVGDTATMRSWGVKDSSILFDLVYKNRKQLQPWLSWVPDVKKEEDSRKFISECIEEYKELESLEMGLWVNDELVGCIGLHDVNKKSRKASLGYWLSKDSQGHGLMTQAVKVLVDYGFSELNLNRIELRASLENKKSIAIPERLGFTREGIIRDDEFVDGRFHDNVVYSVLKKEW